MGDQFPALSPKHTSFIEAQKMFFVATAAATGRINVSPKGMDSLRVVSPDKIAWVNLTGSGNETAGHVQSAPRMTLMFVSFTTVPLILRVYGTATAYHHRDAQWSELASLLPDYSSARQIFSVAVEMVQESCGFSVPYYDYAGERSTLAKWAKRQSKADIEEFWAKHNTATIDGIPTHIEQKNLDKDAT